jgi:hypothetical protein
MVVVVVLLEVLCESIDAVCEKSDLNLGGTCVAFLDGILFNN